MIPTECKVDKYGFLYLDEEYILNEELNYYDNLEKIKSRFFTIDSTDEYIVKYHLEKLNNKEVLQMLEKVYSINACKLSNIDFPIGYYKENDKIRGLIIPNYPFTVSLRHAVIHNNIDKYYNHSEDKRENVLYLLNDILKILENLYDNDIIYTDINPGNFVFWQNEIKIIDFDPKYIFYKENDFYFKMMLWNYRDLVCYVCKRCGINIQDIKSDYDNIKKYQKR